MFTHPPPTDNKPSGEALDVPGLEAIGVIGSASHGFGLAHALARRKIGRGLYSYEN